MDMERKYAGISMKKKLLKYTAAGMLVFSLVFSIVLSALPFSAQASTGYRLTEKTYALYSYNSILGTHDYVPASITKFTYNSRGHVKKESIEEYSGDKTTKSYTTYKYNSKGKVVSSVTKKSGKTVSSIKNTYNSSGKLLTSKVKESGGSSYTLKYTYKSGKATKMVKMTGKTLVSTTTFTYKNSRLASKTEICSDGSKTTTTYYTSGKRKGKVKKEYGTLVTASGKKKFSYTHTYEYDDRGNMTLETVKSKGKKYAQYYYHYEK